MINFKNMQTQIYTDGSCLDNPGGRLAGVAIL